VSAIKEITQTRIRLKSDGIDDVRSSGNRAFLSTLLMSVWSDGSSPRVRSRRIVSERFRQEPGGGSRRWFTRSWNEVWAIVSTVSMWIDTRGATLDATMSFECALHLLGSARRESPLKMIVWGFFVRDSFLRLIGSSHSTTTEVGFGVYQSKMLRSLWRIVSRCGSSTRI